MENVVTYRILPKSEWDKLFEFIERTLPAGTPIPAPELADAAVAERDGEIVGVLFLQFAVHMDSLAIAPEAQGGQVSYAKLAETLDTYFQCIFPPGSRYFGLQGDNSRTDKMIELGFQPTPYTLYVRETS